MMIMVLLLLGFPIFATTTSDLKIGKVIVSGHIQRSAGSSKVVSLTYSQLSGKPTRLSLLLDATGIFQFEFDILQAHEISLWYEKGEAQLFVRPLDSLYIKLTDREFRQTRYPEYQISGTYVEVSKDILKFHQFKHLDKFVPVAASKSVEEYLGDLKKRIAVEDSVLAVFNEQYNPTETFRNWAKWDNLYRNANFLVDFEYHHFLQKTRFEGDLYDTTIFPVNDTRATASSWYQYHLWQYVQRKYIQSDSLISVLLRDQKFGLAYETALQNILAAEPSGTGRDLICYQILFSLSERTFSDFKRLMKNADKYLSDSGLRTVLTKQMQDVPGETMRHISFYKADSGTEIEATGNVIGNLVSMHSGKVIYIDLWATWCGPCKAELPFAKDLQESYKDQPVMFVNLCLFSDRQAWRKAIDTQKIDGENYFFDHDQSELLKSKLKIGGFPTYMIINKNGELVDQQAPRPSSGHVVRQSLDNALK